MTQGTLVSRSRLFLHLKAPQKHLTEDFLSSKARLIRYREGQEHNSNQFPNRSFNHNLQNFNNQSNLEGLVSNFNASQDARLSKFEADFKQQQSEMTNKIDTVLKAITDRIMGALPSDTVKNPKLNVNSTSPICLLDQLQTVTEFRTRQTKEPEQTLEDEFKDLHLNLLVLEVLAHAPMYNAILDKYVESLELGKNRSCVNIIPLYLFKKLNIGLLEETDYVFGLANGTKSYPVGIVRDVEVHIGRLKLLNNFYVIDMKKDLETPLLVGSGFLATANAFIDCRKAKIAVGEMITRNMWESEDLIENLINWDKPPKNRDRAWHAKIRLIDPDREEFTKTLQSFPTSRKLSERESPKEIINLDHIYDT
ncbi:retrovirus-related pol polyprotein from transposon TNT 1-94 [Tanacetum coccineum]